MEEFNYHKIVQAIYKDGFFTIDEFYDAQEISQLRELATKIKSHEVMRNFDHPAYQLAVNVKMKKLLLGVAAVKTEVNPQHTRGKQYIDERNISISFACKGASFGNAKRAPLAYHFDDSFVTGVLSLELPKTGSGGDGLNIYRNFRSIPGGLFFNRVISRLFIKSALLRRLVKPQFIPYRVGQFTLFFGDRSLHGVEDCLVGDRISLAVNLSQVTLQELISKYQGKSHVYLEKYI